MKGENYAMVTTEQLKIMKHMLGLDYEKKPYRNYSYYYEPQPDCEDLVNKGLATKHNGDKEGHVVYHLTKEGIEMVYKKPLSPKNYKKLVIE